MPTPAKAEALRGAVKVVAVQGRAVDLGAVVAEAVKVAVMVVGRATAGVVGSKCTEKLEFMNNSACVTALSS